VTLTTKYLWRNPAAVQPWAETCGQIRPLIEAADEAAAEVHYVEIEHAKLYYHRIEAHPGARRAGAAAV
jgi:hypothetical protein